MLLEEPFIVRADFNHLAAFDCRSLQIADELLFNNHQLRRHQFDAIGELAL